MNCDQVFDVLTRGPFPTGAASDIDVQRHLVACADCRQLAEALRPALDLIHESVPPEESWGLPGYWDDTTVPQESLEGKSVEQKVLGSEVRVRPRRLTVRKARVIKERPKRKRQQSRTLRHYLFATVAGIAAAVFVFALRMPTEPSAPVAASLMPVAWPPIKCSINDGEVASVLPVRAKELAQQLSKCTACHTAGERHWLTRPATLAVSQTCLECHQFVAHR